MSFILKQSTSVTERIGPFVDSGDGDTDESALTIQKANVLLSKNGGALTAANADQGTADVGMSYDAAGYYAMSLDTTDTATLGRLIVDIHVSGALHVWREYVVVPAGTYDTLVGTGTIDGLALDTLLGRLVSITTGDKSIASTGTITHKKADGTTECTEVLTTDASAHTWA